jgi:phosphatidylserine/phosphatidylglycerophosphate/cardiolipin synthase-like enzyme
VVVTLPAAPSTIAGKLPTEGPIHASFGRTEEVLEEIARAAVTSFTVMSPFVNPDGAEFAMHLFRQTGASQRTLITRRAGPTRLAIDPRLPELDALGVKVLNYLLPAEDGYETFHAKIVIADADQAYVGSANMTRYARHSMEVGVVLKGRPARAVSALVRTIERISRPVGVR